MVNNTNQTGAGSLRQAILDANSTVGTNVIRINITNITKIITTTNSLPDITNPVVLDGTAQTGFSNSPIVELNGTSAGAGSDGLRLATSNSVVRGLVINRFSGDGVEIQGTGNLVEGCIIGLSVAGTTDLGNAGNGILVSNAPNNVIGGIFSTQRNVISGNSLNGVIVFGVSATNNLVLGNYLGLNSAGSAALGNTANGLLLSNAPRNIVGGTLVGARNVVGGNGQSGLRLENTNAFANLVLGNFIGLDVTGTTNRPNSQQGVYLFNAPSNTIGGASAAARNVISGNSQAGVRLEGNAARGNLVLGNFIGTQVSSDVAASNGSHGVHFFSTAAHGNFIGGLNAGEPNVIAFNGGDAIYVQAGTNNALRANSIFLNAGLGIDLGTDGMLANDSGDPDSGANQLQNSPLLTAVTNNGNSTSISGSLNSTPNTQFALDFFANVLFDVSGAGEGQFYLGSTNVTTGADSNANFTVTLPVGLTGRYVCATATDPFGNTSEFSSNVGARSTVANNMFTVTNTNNSGPGSLRQALIDANMSITVAADLINFVIPGAGPHTIAPVNALPPVADMVIIDGYTQSGATSNSLAVGDNAVLKIQLDGLNAPNNFAGLSLWGGNSIVRGLGIVRFKSASGHGIEVFSRNNVIAGNFIGVGLDGATDMGNGGRGIYISGAGSNVVGGATAASRNLISGNTGDGIELNSGNAVGNVVQGNYIGTDVNGARGAADLGNAAGINLNGAPLNTIGGHTILVRNFIADNAGAGITTIGNTGTNNLIQGNLIGTDVNGAPLGNNSHGISIASSSNFIGGTGAGEGNTIVYNNGDGVFVTSGTNNVIRANSIFDNGGVTVGNLGIDLGNNGLQANDPGDPDTGANQLQNFPVLTNAVANVANTQIQGTLNSRSNTTYEVDFYSNVVGDPSGNGEGQKWLGSAMVTTDFAGYATINATVPGVVFGRRITATATDPSGNTSEFATNILVSSTIPPTTFTVSNSNDGGAGSLHAAISNANGFASFANDLIAFSIPGTGPHVIAPRSPLASLIDPVTIDGYTQPGAQTNTLPNGNDAVLKIQLSGTNAPNSVDGLNVDGLRLEANGCIIRGLAIVGFGDGIEVVSSSNLIEGCFIGLQADGLSAWGNANNGILISGAANNTIGGSTSGARNVISGNNGVGIWLNGVGASNSVIAGNFVGTDASGTKPKGNGNTGVWLDRPPANTIGGVTASARNVISANAVDGIRIYNATATNNLVLNNYIGTDATGTLALGNGLNGIQLGGVFAANVIGSPNQGGNTIAFNGQDGVAISGFNQSVRGNSIHDNGGGGPLNLGIDIGVNGPGLNNFPDDDSGQNYPELTSATANPSGTQIQGTLRSRTNTTYQLDFFSSLAGDSSGYGEGQKYLGSTNVTTDVNGSNSFVVTVSGVVLGRFITATATNPNGNTSEFSPWIRAGSTIPPKTFTVLNTNDSGPGSLREAILLSNLEVSSTNNTIEFNIAGNGPYIIAPLAGLPVPTEAITIDGYTQPGASPNTFTNGNNAVLKIRLDGVNAALGPAGLLFSDVGGNIVRGLSITRFGHGIQSGIIPFGTNGNNRIEGNFIGLDVDGVTVAANFGYGVHIYGSPGNVIGGTTPGARNIISGNGGYGVILVNIGSHNNRVEGNYIGTDSSGSIARGNHFSGVYLQNATTNMIGGTNALARNVISANLNSGVFFFDPSMGNSVEGNFIGTDVTGNVGLGNSQHGVFVGSPASGNFIGGTNPGAGNRIAFNFQHGVIVAGTNNTIRANSIFSNSWLGIDLGFDDAVTANDPGDPDTGANQFQNFPIISAATISPVITTIQGDLNSKPNTTYQIDFFANFFRNTSGYGEGQQYLGSTNVTTAANSNVSFSVTLPIVAIGRQITATATDPFGNTSEFSPAFAAVGPVVAGFRITRITVTLGVGVLLEWNSEPGKTYRVQYKSTLTDPWTDLSGDVTATGSTASKLDNTITGQSRRFYRVALLTTSPPPKLSILLINNNQLLISWPSSTPASFVLESTTNLTPVVAWAPVTNAPADNGTHKAVLLNFEPQTPGRFYRLRQ